jgi:uncharacterized protein (TIGR02246 family)
MSTDTTRSVLEVWIERFNAGDSAGIAALYAPDAVNHQVALEPVAGREQIEQMHREVFAAEPLECIPVNVLVDGEWAALEWVDPQGFRGSGFFHIVDGQIALQRGYWDSAGLTRTHPNVH